MSERQTASEYLSGPEELRRQELVWGVVREPPAPFCDHQSVVTRATVLLDTHVRTHNLGRVLVSPVDVVLDDRKALIVQPDVVFVSNARASLVRDRIWGPPDLVVEILSVGMRRRDITDKRQWYRRYGVREYWVIDPLSGEVAVMPFSAEGRPRRRGFRGRQRVRSAALPEFDATAAAFFE
jgi:Uma2 family endonuclease